MTNEPKGLIFLGVVEIEQGETIGLALPAGADLDADTIKVAKRLRHALRLVGIRQ